MISFREKVYEIVRKIPKGETLTYKEVAERVGKPEAARAVGNVLKQNKNKDVPCHRVVRSDGKLGGYNGLRGIKGEILKRERASR